MPVDQPTASVTRADVERVVARDFSPEVRAAVVLLLERYGVESYEREPERVRLAALKLAGGDVEALHRHVETAKTDYRDVLAAAEYPGHSRRVTWEERGEEEAVFRSDAQQYQDWLGR